MSERQPVAQPVTEIARSAVIGEQNKIIAVAYTALQECRDLARAAVDVHAMDDALAKIDRITTIASNFLEEWRQKRDPEKSHKAEET